MDNNSDDEIICEEFLPRQVVPPPPDQGEEGEVAICAEQYDPVHLDNLQIAQERLNCAVESLHGAKFHLEQFHLEGELGRKVLHWHATQLGETMSLEEFHSWMFHQLNRAFRARQASEEATKKGQKNDDKVHLDKTNETEEGQGNNTKAVEERMEEEETIRAQQEECVLEKGPPNLTEAVQNGSSDFQETSEEAAGSVVPTDFFQQESKGIIEIRDELEDSSRMQEDDDDDIGEQEEDSDFEAELRQAIRNICQPQDME